MSSDDHNSHLDDVETLEIAAGKQADDWVYLRNEIRVMLDKKQDEYKNATTPTGVLYKIQQKIKRVFEQVNNQIKSIEQEKYKDLEKAIIDEHNSTQEMESFRTILEQLGNAYKDVEHHIFYIQRMKQINDHTAILKMDQLLKDYIEKLRSLNTTNE